MIRVKRDQFLQKLEEVSPGLSRSGIEEQSACFAFRRGLICTYNEQVFCSAKSNFPKEFTGAIQAKKLLDLVRKMSVDELQIKPDGNKFSIFGKNEVADLRMEPNVLLPIDKVETGTKWIKLHSDFTDAVAIVGECASKNQELFTCTCVHLTPKWMEAFDNSQMVRYNLKTGVSSSFLVRRDSIKHLPSHDFIEFAETPNWIHFRTNSGTIMSCVRYTSEKNEFQDLSPFFKIRGEPTSLPKTLGMSAEKAEIFSKDEGDDNLVQVEIENGMMLLTGQGAAGRYRKKLPLRYKGKPIKFRVGPRLLIELLKRHTEVEISTENILRIDGGRWCYAVCLEPI